MQNLIKYYFYVCGFEYPNNSYTVSCLGSYMLNMAYVLFLLIGILVIFDFILSQYSSSKNLYAIAPSKFYTASLDILFVAFVTLYIISLMISSIGFVFNLSDNLNGDVNVFDIQVYVVASQWYWNVTSCTEFLNAFTFNMESIQLNAIEIYSSGNEKRWFSDKVIFLPSNLLICFKGTSTDVIHSFGLPSCSFKFDCIPGRTQSFNIIFNKEGSYDAHCYELCGANHAYMQLTLEVISVKDFISYLYSIGGDMTSNNNELVDSLINY